MKGEPVEGIHENVISVILAKMSTEAQTTCFKLRQLGDNSLEGDEMLKYVKTKFAVNCSKNYFTLLYKTTLAYIE